MRILSRPFLAQLAWHALVLPIFAAAVVLVPLSVAGQTLRLPGLALLGIGLVAVASLSVRAIKSRHHAATTVAESVLKTAFYALRVVSHQGVVPVPATRGGGLDRLGEDVLLSTGDGHLYVLKIGNGDELRAIELPTRVPANRDEFAAAFGGSARAATIGRLLRSRTAARADLALPRRRHDRAGSRRPAASRIATAATRYRLMRGFRASASRISSASRATDSPSGAAT